MRRITVSVYGLAVSLAVTGLVFYVGGVIDTRLGYNDRWFGEPAVQRQLKAAQASSEDLADERDALRRELAAAEADYESLLNHAREAAAYLTAQNDHNALAFWALHRQSKLRDRVPILKSISPDDVDLILVRMQMLQRLGEWIERSQLLPL